MSLLAIMISCKEDEGKIGASEVTAEFTAGTTGVLTGGVVVFEDQSMGDVTHWSWTFEGGTPERSTDRNPAVTYAAEGAFEVKLVVSNARHTHVVAKDGYIVVTKTPQPVTADFTADKLSILNGESIIFTDASQGNATQWAWEFIPASGATLTSSEQNPEITFPDPGTYTVKLTVSNSQYSDEEVKTDYIAVVDATDVAADFSADKTMIYSGQEIAFTDATAGAATDWAWTFEGGTPATSTEQNPAVTYNDAGKFKVKLVASNDSKTSTKEVEGFVTVVPGDGLLAFLPFNGNSSDAGPLALDVDNGAAGVTFDGADRNADVNSTAVFDGSGSLNILPVNEKQLAVSSYSVGLWLKTDQLARMMIWQEGGGGAGLPSAWFRINDNASNQLYRFNINTGVIMNMGTGDGASALSDNAWHYVVCTRDVDTQVGNVYVDGSLVKSKDALDVRDVSNDLGFRIGGQDSAPGEVSNLYTGQLDDLVIYNRVLTESEITLLSGF